VHWIAKASMRHYVAAWELKQAGLDWRSLILSRCLSGRALLVAQLKADPRYCSEAERVRAFLAAGGGSRSSYFNWSRKLQAPVTPSTISLQTPPPPVKAIDSDPLRILRQRHNEYGENSTPPKRRSEISAVQKSTPIPFVYTTWAAWLGLVFSPEGERGLRSAPERAVLPGGA